MIKPLVSCVMPTADRLKFIPSTLNYFVSQDYPNLELVIVDDGKTSISPLLPNDPRIKYFYSESFSTLEEKRNYACEKASGEIIIHWDDDDWYAYDWVSRQVNYLISSGADLCGIEFIHYYSSVTDIFMTGSSNNRNNPSRPVQIINNSTLAYWKPYWLSNPFTDIRKSYEEESVVNPRAKIFAHDYIDGFVKVLHPTNTNIAYFEDTRHKALKKS